MAEKVCPWWAGYLLVNPLRKMIHNPEKLFQNFIKPGMKIIDFGSAMGYFSLPFARMTGKEGKVFCFDIQEKMLTGLIKRARKAKLDEIIVPCLITDNDGFQQLNNSIDFGLLFAVAHEVPNQKQLFEFLNSKLKNGAVLYFAEPAGHVKLTDFISSVDLALASGFSIERNLKVSKSHAVLLKKG